MSNQNYLDRVKKGREAWNRWRQENPAERPNFYYADLRGMDLKDYDFRNADMTNAKLGGADLTGAQLQDSELLGADLEKARLVNADLSGANLMGATAASSVFTGANITGANLMGIDLKSADLTGVRGMTHRHARDAITNDQTLLPQLVQEIEEADDNDKKSSETGFFSKIKSFFGRTSGS